jgi:metallo-beta-lactamase family protein
MRLSFHGADRDVTGSCHLVECSGKRILIDCGLHQGSRALEEENAEPFRFDPAALDCLLLTHAHLDHVGRVPLLVKRGFRGEIVTTAASRELARLVMLDSAHLMEQDAERDARHASRRGNHATNEPLYTVVDTLDAIEQFGRTASYGQPLELAGGIRATFFDAGHILGSASILLELEEAGQRRRVLFSGDLGNPGRPLLRDPADPPAADAVVMETTYGDRRHKPIGPSVEEFYDAVSDAHGRGGNVVVPTFALERAQELLYYLREGMAQGRVPSNLQVILDSPMAITATDIFRRHPEGLAPDIAQTLVAGHDPLAVPGLRLTRETADSKALNEVKHGAVIMAGSGMCTGGRVRHHLRHNLWREASSVVFVGFAGAGTLARIIIDGAKQVKLFGEEIAVRARIYTIGGFSAHADQAELLAWQQHTRAARTFLVHGEEDAMRAFGGRLSGTKVEMPTVGQTIEL